MAAYNVAPATVLRHYVSFGDSNGNGPHFPRATFTRHHLAGHRNTLRHFCHISGWTLSSFTSSKPPVKGPLLNLILWFSNDTKWGFSAAVREEYIRNLKECWNHYRRSCISMIVVPPAPMEPEDLTDAQNFERELTARLPGFQIIQYLNHLDVSPTIHPGRPVCAHIFGSIQHTFGETVDHLRRISGTRRRNRALIVSSYRNSEGAQLATDPGTGRFRYKVDPATVRYLDWWRETEGELIRIFDDNVELTFDALITQTRELGPNEPRRLDEHLRFPPLRERHHNFH